jgi:prolyl 4-hydroxylase
MPVWLISSSNAQENNINNVEEPPQELGTDCSWPMHQFPIRHPDRDEQHKISMRYVEYMDGCFQHYTEEECLTSDKERMAMNLHQTRAMQNYTAAGYARMRAPAPVMEILEGFYKENYRSGIQEMGPPGAVYVNHWAFPTKMLPLEGLPYDTEPAKRSSLQKQHQGQPSLTSDQRQEIIAQIQPILETWTKMPLIPTSLYGIRIYQRGAILTPHVDRLPLVISAIVNVASNVNKPWPLELIGHDGTAVNVTMEPGDLVSQQHISLIACLHFLILFTFRHILPTQQPEFCVGSVRKCQCHSRSALSARRR